MRSVTCSFTGHRPEKLPWGKNEKDPRCAELKKHLAREIISAYNDGYRRFICGMAKGADMYFCEAALHIRDNMFGDISVEAAIPCETQPDGWSDEEQRRYREDVSSCDVVTYVSRNYFPGCMMKRNRYMVDQSSRLIAVYCGMQSGTMNTVLYAMRSDVTVITVDPGSF